MKDVKFSRLTMGVLLALATSASFAHGMDRDMPVYKGALPTLSCPTLRCGFYAGAQVGYSAYRINQSIVGPAGSFSANGSLTSWVTGLFLGYGQYFNQYYLGAELLGNYNGADRTIVSGSDDDGDSFNRKAKIAGTWGLAVIPGLRLNDATLGYIRLGYDWTNFKHSATFVNNGGAPESQSNSRTLGGFDFGFGLETLICDNWSVRTQYDHIWYNSRTTTVATPDGDVRVRTTPSGNLYTLGVVYHF